MSSPMSLMKFMVKMKATSDKRIIEALTRSYFPSIVEDLMELGFEFRNTREFSSVYVYEVFHKALKTRYTVIDVDCGDLKEFDKKPDFNVKWRIFGIMSEDGSVEYFTAVYVESKEPRKHLLYLLRIDRPRVKKKMIIPSLVVKYVCYCFDENCKWSTIILDKEESEVDKIMKRFFGGDVFE